MDWVRLKGNLPTAGVRAMVIQPRDRELVVGTFGRAIWVTDIFPLEVMNDSILGRPVFLFPPKRATLYKTRETYGNTIEELNGDMFFRGENPPVGSEIVYYVKEDLRDSVVLTIGDLAAKSVLRTLRGPGTAGLHRLQWDLKKERAPTKDSTRSVSEMTPTEKEYAERVAPGEYWMTLTAGTITEHSPAVVRREPDGVKVGAVRK